MPNHQKKREAVSSNTDCESDEAYEVETTLVERSLRSGNEMKTVAEVTSDLCALLTKLDDKTARKTANELYSEFLSFDMPIDKFYDRMTALEFNEEDPIVLKLRVEMDKLKQTLCAVEAEEVDDAQQTGAQNTIVVAPVFESSSRSQPTQESPSLPPSPSPENDDSDTVVVDPKTITLDEVREHIKREESFSAEHALAIADRFNLEFATGSGASGYKCVYYNTTNDAWEAKINKKLFLGSRWRNKEMAALVRSLKDRDRSAPPAPPPTRPPTKTPAKRSAKRSADDAPRDARKRTRSKKSLTEFEFDGCTHDALGVNACSDSVLYKKLLRTEQDNPSNVAFVRTDVVKIANNRGITLKTSTAYSEYQGVYYPPNDKDTYYVITSKGKVSGFKEPAIAALLLSLDRAIGDAASDTAASDTAASDTAASDTPASDTPASDTAASDTAASDAPASDAPASDAPAPDTVASDISMAPAPAASDTPMPAASTSALAVAPVHLNHNVSDVTPSSIDRAFMMRINELGNTHNLSVAEKRMFYNPLREFVALDTDAERTAHFDVLYVNLGDWLDPESDATQGRLDFLTALFTVE